MGEGEVLTPAHFLNRTKVSVDFDVSKLRDIWKDAEKLLGRFWLSFEKRPWRAAAVLRAPTYRRSETWSTSVNRHRDWRGGSGECPASAVKASSTTTRWLEVVRGGYPRENPHQISQQPLPFGNFTPSTQPSQARNVPGKFWLFFPFIVNFLYYIFVGNTGDRSWYVK